MVMVPTCRICGNMIDAGESCEVAILMEKHYTFCKNCQPILHDWYGDFARYHKGDVDYCDRCFHKLDVGDICTMSVFGGLMGFLCENCTTQARILLREVKYPTRDVLKRLA